MISKSARDQFGLFNDFENLYLIFLPVDWKQM